jgi:predicted small metal-binding protein
MLEYIATFRCADIGMNCAYTIIGKDEDEIIRNIKNHARRIHGLSKFPPAMTKKIEAGLNFARPNRFSHSVKQRLITD